MRKIEIKPNKNGDSRAADHVPTIVEFMEANSSHKQDVSNLMDEFANEIKKEERYTTGRRQMSRTVVCSIVICAML